MSARAEQRGHGSGNGGSSNNRGGNTATAAMAAAAAMATAAAASTTTTAAATTAATATNCDSRQVCSVLGQNLPDLCTWPPTTPTCMSSSAHVPPLHPLPCILDGQAIPSAYAWYLPSWGQNPLSPPSWPPTTGSY